jgi:glucose-1-phosphate adenylyltransferase
MKIQGVNIQDMRSGGGILSKALTFILAGGEGRRLGPLTRYRPKPLLPFGGSFRIVDFTLSNCFNSGLQQIYVLTQYENESIHSYLRRWSPAAERRPHFILPNPPSRGKRYRGTADAILQNLPLMESGNYEFVVILSASHIYRMDYRELVRFHVARAAEVTIAGVYYPATAAADAQLLEVDDEDRVIGVERRCHVAQTRSYSHMTLANLSVYVFNRETILKALYTNGYRPPDLDNDVIPNLIGSFRVHAYRHENRLREPLYWRDVGTLDSYYASNMDLLARVPLFDPYSDHWPVRSAETSTVAMVTQTATPRSAFSNCIVSHGTDVACASVQNSIISSGVVLENGVTVQDSILMPGVTIGQGSSVRRAIIDSNVRVAAGDRIGYDDGHDRSRFPITSDGVVVVAPLEKTVAPLQHLRSSIEWPV